MLTRETFRGPWAGLPVAWSEDDRFDEDRYRACVADCCRAGVPGVYTGGTTGEFYAMEWDEFCAVATATVEECHAQSVPAMIGCSSTYTLGAERRAAFAAEIGADAIQVALPFWMEVDERHIVSFFEAVSRASGGLPLSVYETQRAKLALTLKQHGDIKAAVPSYLMVKSNEGTIGCTPEGCKALSELVNVFMGESKWCTLGPFGAQGGCSSMVYWNPRVTLAFWDLVAKADWPAVQEMHQRVEPMFDFLVGTFAAKGLTDTAFDRLGGLASGFLQTSLRSRGPYPSVSTGDVAILRQWYTQHFPEMLWAGET